MADILGFPHGDRPGDTYPPGEVNPNLVDSSARLDGIVALLTERSKTHGSYEAKADIVQRLKEVMRSCPGWETLSPAQRESLDMIVHKIGRILSGDPKFRDHWDDIVGYAHLIARAL